jgi:hypothetical protein
VIISLLFKEKKFKKINIIKNKLIPMLKFNFFSFFKKYKQDPKENSHNRPGKEK